MTRFSDLPLFASDTELAGALLGKRAGAWRDLVPLLEHDGFPKIDPTMGGRYTRAVVHFFDHQYDMAENAPAAPPGVEEPISWERERSRRRRV